MTLFTYKQGPKVLIIDDQISSIRPVDYILNQVGCTSEHCTSGPESAELIAFGDFDLVVLDWVMPFWNGEQVLKKTDEVMHASGVSKQIPFLIYTSLDLYKLQIPNTSHLIYRGYISKMDKLSVVTKAILKCVGQ